MSKGPSESPDIKIETAQQAFMEGLFAKFDRVEEIVEKLLKHYQQLNPKDMPPNEELKKEIETIKEFIAHLEGKDNEDEYKKAIEILKQTKHLLEETIFNRKSVRERVDEALDVPNMGLSAEELSGDLDEEPGNIEFTEPIKAGNDDEEKVPTTGEIEQLQQDMNELLNELTDEEREKRALLRRLNLKLYKTVKSLFDVLDFKPENVKEEGLRMILIDMQTKIQETIDLIDLDELKKLAKKPYLEIKKEMEGYGKGLRALWEDMEEVLKGEGLLEILRAETEKEVTEVSDKDIEEVQPEPEPKTPQSDTITPTPTPPRPAPPRASITPPPAPQPVPESHSAPSTEEMIQLMENDESIKELLDKLEIIRAAFGEVENYEQTGTPPEGIKDDWNTFKEVFDKRMVKSDPLIMAGTRETLADNYIELLRQNKNELFQNWNDNVFLTEMGKRLKRVYINNKKLLKN